MRKGRREGLLPSGKEKNERCSPCKVALRMGRERMRRIHAKAEDKVMGPHRVRRKRSYGRETLMGRGERRRASLTLAVGSDRERSVTVAQIARDAPSFSPPTHWQTWTWTWTYLLGRTVDTTRAS